MINKKKRNFISFIPKIFLGIFSLSVLINFQKKESKFVNYKNWILKKEDLS